MYQRLFKLYNSFPKRRLEIEQKFHSMCILK